MIYQHNRFHGPSRNSPFTFHHKKIDSSSIFPLPFRPVIEIVYIECQFLWYPLDKISKCPVLSLPVSYSPCFLYNTNIIIPFPMTGKAPMH